MSMANGGGSDHHMESTLHLTRHEIANLSSKSLCRRSNKIVPPQCPPKTSPWVKILSQLSGNESTKLEGDGDRPHEGEKVVLTLP